MNSVFHRKAANKNWDLCVCGHTYLEHDPYTRHCTRRDICMGFVRVTQRNKKPMTNLLIFLALMGCAIMPLLATVVDDSVQDSTQSYSYVIPIKAVTELDIGWPPMAHLQWDKGYLEFKGTQPTKAAREFFNVYLKDLVDSYIAEQLGKKKKERRK